MSARGGTVGVVACGALALHVSAIARRRGWAVDVHPIAPQLHNRPERIAGAVAAKLDDVAGRYERVAVAYAECGTGGSLDSVLAERDVERLLGRVETWTREGTLAPDAAELIRTVVSAGTEGDGENGGNGGEDD